MREKEQWILVPLGLAIAATVLGFEPCSATRCGRRSTPRVTR